MIVLLALELIAFRIVLFHGGLYVYLYLYLTMEWVLVCHG